MRTADYLTYRELAEELPAYLVAYGLYPCGTAAGG